MKYEKLLNIYMDDNENNDTNNDINKFTENSMIIINEKNIINSDNNRIVYKFPSIVEFDNNTTIELTCFNIYYSWFDISDTTQKYNYKNCPSFYKKDMSYIITCNLINDDVLMEFTLKDNIRFGDLISIENNRNINIKAGRYNELVLTIYDKNYNELEILDNDILIGVELKNKIKVL